MLANTIMRCNVVCLASEMSLPSVWVIHESWPQDEFDHYAKEVLNLQESGAFLLTSLCLQYQVFMRKDIDGDLGNC